MRRSVPRILCMVLAAGSPALAGEVVAVNELFDGPIPTPPPAQPAAGAQPAKPPQPDSFFKGWSGSVDVGLNGSEGNNRTFNFRGAVTGERKTDLMITTGYANYTRATSGNTITKNRAELGARNSWLFEKDSRWSYFVEGKYEYDDFQDWRSRVSLGNGIGYAIIRTDTMTLNSRAGVGVTREIGGSDNRWVPNGILGVDFSYKITERQKFTASVEYIPSFLNFADHFRVISKACYEIIVDPEVKLSFKAGVEDRYDALPSGNAEKNDVDYFVMLSWSF